MLYDPVGIRKSSLLSTFSFSSFVTAENLFRARCGAEDIGIGLILPENGIAKDNIRVGGAPPCNHALASQGRAGFLLPPSRDSL